MGKEESCKVDVEEGEISDTASMVEISEEVFKMQESAAAAMMTAPKESNREARVWTMRDLYKTYPTICRGYPSGLYNLAWAQAVQNKPLNDLFVMDVDPEENSNSKEDNKNERDADDNKVVLVDSGDEIDVKIVDIEKEEGELEEGEIDFDSEPADEEIGVFGSNQNKFEKQVNVIREALESVTLNDAEKSFEDTCSRLYRTFENLKEFLSGNQSPGSDSLIQLSFTAVQVANSVFSSMNHNEKEENKRQFSRLLSFVKEHTPSLFSPDQRKEIEAMTQSLDSLDLVPMVKEDQVIIGMDVKDSGDFPAIGSQDITSSTKLPLDFIANVSVLQNNRQLTSEDLKSGVSSFKGRGILLPLLDLHKDHDEDSLPSPTQATVSSSPFHKALISVDGMVKSSPAPAKEAPNSVASRLHPYETDALKAVSFYQQKFGRSSFSMHDRLPSPTPSEEGDNRGDDVSGEVSSAPIVGNLKPSNQPVMGHPVVNSVPSTTSVFSSNVDSSSTQGLVATRNAAPTGSASNPTMKVSAKSRDPRLRFANSDSSVTKTDPVRPVSSRKQKIDEETNLDGPSLKRKRNGLESCTGTGGWLEDSLVVGPQLMSGNPFKENAETDMRKTASVAYPPDTSSGNPNVANTGNEKVPVTIGSSTASLHALWKDIPVNPTMLFNILKMGQQHLLAAESQQKSAEQGKSGANSPSLDSIHSLAPLVNVNPFITPGNLQKLAGPLKVPSQVAPLNLQEDTGKVRMKPRDPRRILHGNALQKSGSLGNEQFKTILSSALSEQGNKDNFNGLNQDGQGDTKLMLSQTVPPLDITRQFTKNLKNIADIMSVSQAPTTPSLSTQPAPIKADRVDIKTSSSDEQRPITNSVTEVGVAAGPSCPQDMWGDVEHLFEGYDDQQKAAIQRERARRIEEQKKMFAARKLCLVLDLDHTLLNSAKFMEVDPVHDEILRKKEEQDREKQQRHLFRFAHMAMWTKLRPGIWNFLEKASKLYELHLYTMGNKLYATEMAKVLDPNGVLFAGRVISKGDDGDPFDGDERVPKSKDLEGVLGMESGVVIIDDSIRVWPHNKLNLIVVERYIYFPCSRRQFGLQRPALLEIDHDERPEDGTLASCLSVIERLHHIFFSHHALDEVDVRNILASEQRKILGGCRIVFSRVFPVGEANPHLHPLWQTAEQFGAVCTNQIDDQVTHVVAISPGTDKVNWALASGRFVVHPGWVEASALLYRRANEQDFAIKPQQTPS